jgi:hypothetical protein
VLPASAAGWPLRKRRLADHGGLIASVLAPATGSEGRRE